jgi:hypothetical protein
MRTPLMPSSLTALHLLFAPLGFPCCGPRATATSAS